MSDNNDERRLWVGNLDLRITEFNLLKILQKCGHIEKFDMIFHRSGPQSGQPRGYAFVTYGSVPEASLALEKLSGKQVGSKNMIIRLAKNVNYDELERPKTRIEIPALAAGGQSAEKNAISKEMTIQAIEAKLKMLERKNGPDDFEINQTVANEPPLIQKYQYNKNKETTTRTNSSYKSYSKTRHKPYNRNSRR